jgi:hypothetical protein
MKLHRSVPFVGMALAAALAAAGPSRAQATAPTAADSALMETGRTYTRWFWEGKADTLYALFGPGLRQAVRDPAGLAGFIARERARLGPEAGVESETVERRGDQVAYVRIARFASVPVRIRLQVATDAAGKISVFGIRPYSEEGRHADYRTKTALRLPFEGEWFVGWGGRTREQNYHAVLVDQRFAYDLLVMRGGKTHDGEGTRLEDYYCWRKPILAPGAGTVAVALDSLADLVPPEHDERNPAGNHVIIDHGNGEFSLLAHLRRGSVAVRRGDRVEAGRKMGECGNSGNTSEPHLHYHLQNTAVFGLAEGLPPQFQNYVADGRPVARGEPVKGQAIAPAPR